MPPVEHTAETRPAPELGACIDQVDTSFREIASLRSQ
jgi:hypothetical protein